ncbi:MAG TPA: ABC transporter permease [Mycobacteriales bacterium]|nr:ABC transporter permease [Mycobacteriales bacterium]
MHQFIGFTISGLVTAGIYGIVACGLTLTYTTTGIFNWAHGSFVAIGAFTYWQLTVSWGLPEPVAAIACVLVVGPLLGLVLERGIMHRLEGTSEAIRMVVTLALLLGVVAGINWVWDPATPRHVTELFANHIVTISGQRIPYNDVLVIAVALAVALALRLLLYRLRAGVEMRASVDDRTLTTLVGASVKSTATRAWIVSCMLAMLAGVLIAPRSTMSSSALALLIVNAYAAAVIGRLRSLPLTFLGALVLGLANDYGQGYLGSDPTIPASQYLIGMVNVLPVIVLFIVLQLLPQSRLRGGRSLRVREVSSKPTWHGSGTLAVVCVVGTLALAPLLRPGDLNTMSKVWGLAIIALSLVPLVGYAGRLAVCPLTFGAIGAITIAHATPGGSIVGLLYAAAVTAAVGALVSLSAIRLSGLYLALATAAFAVMMDGWIFKLPAFTIFGHKFDLFQGGNLSIRRFRFPGVDTASDHAFFVFGAVVFAVLVLAVTAIRRSEFGLRLIALKDSQVAFATLGLSQRLTTVAVFALSAAIAGVGGAVFGAAFQQPSPDVFTFFNGLGVLVSIVILGVGSIGASIGAGMFLAGPTLANLFPSLTQLSSALIATAGINLGKNPNGAAVDTRAQWRPVLQARAVLIVGFAALVTAYALTLADVVSHWTFAGVVLALVIAVPLIARVITEPAGAVVERDRQADALSADPEDLGWLVPMTEDDLVAVSKALDLPEPTLTGAASHGA